MKRDQQRRQDRTGHPDRPRAGHTEHTQNRAEKETITTDRIDPSERSLSKLGGDVARASVAARAPRKPPYRQPAAHAPRPNLNHPGRYDLNSPEITFAAAAAAWPAAPPTFAAAPPKLPAIFEAPLAIPPAKPPFMPMFFAIPDA